MFTVWASCYGQQRHCHSFSCMSFTVQSCRHTPPDVAHRSDFVNASYCGAEDLLPLIPICTVKPGAHHRIAAIFGNALAVLRWM